MAKLLLTLVLGGTALGASAVGSWYMLKSKTAENAAANPPAAAPLEGGDDNLSAPPSDGGPLDVEEAFRYSALLRSEQEKLKAREAVLEKNEERVALVFEDIRAQQQEIAGLHAQIRDTLQQGEKLLSEIEGRRGELSAEQEKAAGELKELEGKRTGYEQDELTNLKQVAKWLEKMSPEKAAEFLRVMSNDGKMTTAVQLLKLIEERYAAKILESADDATLVVQWTDMLKTMKQPVKEKPTRR
jgi:DNA repair exonuclease SbcCD ATPase subunit